MKKKEAYYQDAIGSIPSQQAPSHIGERMALHEGFFAQTEVSSDLPLRHIESLACPYWWFRFAISTD